MNEETPLPPSQAEARAALAEADQTQTQTRRAIAQAMVAPDLIWWGVIWVVMLSYAQFHSGPNRIWWVFIIAGFAGVVVLRQFFPEPVKRKFDWRIPAFWFVLFVYAAVLLALVEPWSLLENLSAADQTMMDRKISAYFSIISMFGFVLFGLWTGRLFVWIGLGVTALILLGYYLVPGYFYLWMAVTGGGALMLAGIFVRKLWK